MRALITPESGQYFNHISGIISLHDIIMKWKNVSCEIEDFVDTHLGKLRGILRSRVIRLLCGFIKNVGRDKIWPLWNSVSVWICDCRYVCLLVIFVGRNLINSSMKSKKWITRWIEQTIPRYHVPKYGCSPSSFFTIEVFIYMIQFLSTYIVGGGYWQHRFYRLVHMGILWCVSYFSAFLIYRFVKRKKLQINHTI